MYKESILSVSETEKRMQQMKASAAADARRRIAEAKAAGEEAVAQAEKRAEAELAQMQRSADEKAREAALNLAESSANKKAVLHARAENRMDKAVELIVERIVNG